MKKHRKSEKIDATASELMTLEPVLTHLVEKVALPAGSYVPTCIAFVDGCWLAGVDDKETSLAPAFSCPLEEHGVTASCFTAERKHKDVSRRAVGMYNAKCLKEGSG